MINIFHTVSVPWMSFFFALLKLNMLTLGVFIFINILKNSLFVIIASSQDSGVSPWVLGQRADNGSDYGISCCVQILPPR